MILTGTDIRYLQKSRYIKADSKITAGGPIWMILGQFSS